MEDNKAKFSDWEEDKTEKDNYFHIIDSGFMY